jgi:hypothetical protein
LSTALHTLIALKGFKAVLHFDDRENVLSWYCLIMTTYTIEQYYKRRFLRQDQFDLCSFFGNIHSVTQQHQIPLVRR